MPGSGVVVEVQNGVARITLDRPEKRNALTREMLAELLAAMIRLEQSPGLRVLVLAARGDDFCSGMDLKQMQEAAALPGAPARFLADAQTYCDVLTRLVQCRIPTMAVVQGRALAGGFGLALACDMVQAADTAVFSLPEPKRGLVAAIVAPLLVHRLGIGPARYLLLSGRPMNARDALRAGICQGALPSSDALDAEASCLLSTLLEGGPAALETTKRLLASYTVADLPLQMAEAVAISGQARNSAEAREGLQAFAEKRNPAWWAPV